MTATKITGLNEITYMSANDVIPIVHDPAGSPATVKITANSFFANVVVGARFSNTVTLAANSIASQNFTANNLFLIYNTTPGTSGDTVTRGKIWFDSNYIYVATANNTIKRVALTAF